MGLTEQLLPIIVLLPFGAALLALLVGRSLGRWTGLLMVGAALASFSQALWVARQAAGGAPPLFRFDWIPSMNIAAAFRGDPFGLFFALLISGIGTLVGLYALGYMPNLAPTRLGQFFATLTAFMGSMLGIALADDLMLLFVFWEITSLTSYLLIGFWYEEEHARKGAWIALQVTALGGVAMMIGFIAIGVVCGTFSLSQLATQGPLQQTLAASSLAVPALLLVLAGAFTKSAQWPFHFWLPGAMVAPTPVSTYLHAATMVKAGIFLLGRVLPIFAASALWTPLLVSLGLTTFLLGAYQAFCETDLKGILARSTLSTLGLITMLYGLGAADQDALQFLSHATYKGALFLIAGIVEHATHTRDIRQLGGLRRHMPVTFGVCLLVALSMAGVPGLLGFLAKEALYAELLHTHALGSLAAQGLVVALSVLANGLVFAVSVKFLFGIFLGVPTTHTAHAHEAGPILWGPPALLGGLALGLGLFTPLTERLINHFSSSGQAAVHVALVPTHLGPVLLSLASTLLGIALYVGRGRLDRLLDGLPPMGKLWDAAMEAVTAFAVGYSRRWQNGSVRWYFAGTLTFTVGLSSYALWRSGISPGGVSLSLQELQWHGLILCGMLAATALLVVGSGTRLGAAIAITGNGFMTALLFVLYRSPDILLTQILIETVSTIFILLILYYMPPFRPERVSTLGRLVNLAVATGVAVSMFVFILLATSPQFRETQNLALDYLTRSLAEAGGGQRRQRHHRGLPGHRHHRGDHGGHGGGPDRLRAAAGPAEAEGPMSHPTPTPRPATGDSPILRTVARVAVPITVWVSLVIFLQGHNLPGGGFIAGVMVAAAGAMYLLAFGPAQAARISWWRVSVVGLLISVLTGTVPLLVGRTFMDHDIFHFHLPVVGEYELPTATFFDLGVYLIVLGTIMTIFVELAEEEG